MLTEYQMGDKHLIGSPGKWPKWPSLPMKHKDGRAGFILDKTPIGQKVDPEAVCYRTVYVANPWEFFTMKDRPKIDTLVAEIFPSREALLEAGWSVD